MAVTPLFRFSWIDPPDGMRAEELRATCTRLEIELDGERPTLLEDVKTGSSRHSILVPLYSLAEWLAYTWWQFFQVGRDDGLLERSEHDGRLPGRINMRSIGDGYVWPNLSISRDGNRMRIAWKADPSSHAGSDLRYLSSGVAFIERRDFLAAATDVIQAVITRLEEQGVTGTNLHDEWNALRSLDADEVEFCEACGRLGLDPFSEGLEFSEKIERAFNALEPGIFSELLDAASASAVDEDVQWIKEIESAATTRLARSTHRTALSLALAPHDWNHLSSSSDRPYEVGYRQAQSVRNALGIQPTDPLVTNLLPVEVETRIIADQALMGFSTTSGDHERSYLVASWQPSPTSRRFLQARSVWHLGCVPNQRGFLLTASSSHLQKASRAFAAELLAPAAGIAQLLESGRRSPAIADHFEVSDYVVLHQIDNQL